MTSVVREGSQVITAPGWTGVTKTDVSLIDCDVHQVVGGLDEIFPYLSSVHRQQFIDQDLLLPVSGYFGSTADRPDLLAPGHPHVGPDQARDVNTNRVSYAQMREHLLEPWHVDYALLTGGNGFYSYALLPDPDYAAAFCRAFNDWTLEHWAAKDERFLIALAVAPQDPQRAVEEIYRLAGHRQVKAIILPTMARMPYGNRCYHPIWQACEETGLVVAIHVGDPGAGVAGPPTGVGYPTYFIETRMARAQQAQAHVASLVAEGVFERYPRLKALILEAQSWWLSGLMWHLDADWKSLREQTPWLKRKPSEYILEHIRLGSQPFFEPETDEQLFAMLEMIHAEQTLVFASDFPHFDWDDPATTFPKLPEALHRRIFAENARELFGL
jgi:hypothetical protein